MLAVAVATVAGAAAGINQLNYTERQLLFRVTPGVASWYAGLPEGVQESYLPVEGEDGRAQRFKTWWWPADHADAPTILYLHGAKYNLTGQTFRIEQLRNFGFSVLAIDYRGFGDLDTDLPSEASVYEDAQIAWKRLVELQPDPKRRYIYGHSLGGAVAIDLAARLANDRHQAAHGLIVESSFTNLSDIAKVFTLSWMPMQLLLKQKFDSVTKIAEVSIPVLVVHGIDDRYVPARFSQRLFAAIPGNNKQLLLVEGANHNNSMRGVRHDTGRRCRSCSAGPPTVRDRYLLIASCSSACFYRPEYLRSLRPVNSGGRGA
ncbi:MAG: alpha/beta hydrolase [Pseudomonadota bacterium]